MQRRNLLALLAAVALAWPLSAFAQEYPNKPIRLVVPFPPGGVADLLARTLAERLQARLGQSVVVENKAGAGTVLASDFVAAAPPDGYTLLLAASSLGAAPAIMKKVRYDPVKSFAPVTLVAQVSHWLVVNPKLPVNSVAELIAYAKARPGQLSYGSTGTGTSTHLEAELFEELAGIHMVHIPYRGSGPALTDLIGGQTQLMFDALGSSVGMVKDGRLRALAVTTVKRSPAAPEVPSVAESGLPGFDVMPWLGIVAPAGTPTPIVVKLHAEIVQAMDTPEVREQFRQRGLPLVLNTPAEFGPFIVQETAKWLRVVKAAGIQPE
jgi:tripartite-type tricarboxylate transporter receptor subunit TctC